jgi:hypothetical protein
MPLATSLSKPRRNKHVRILKFKFTCLGCIGKRHFGAVVVARVVGTRFGEFFGFSPASFVGAVARLNCGCPRLGCWKITQEVAW